MVEKSLVLGIEMQTENGHVGTGWQWEGGTSWESWHWHIYATICKIYPGGSAGKESACNAGDLGLIPGLGRCPGEGNGCALQLFLPGEFNRWRSLAGYSPWGCRVGHDFQFHFHA